MKKRNFHLSDSRARQGSQETGTGITIADIVRRAIDEYLRRPRQAAGLAVD